MKINVPFFKQTNSFNCGPFALKMVLAYFGEDFDIQLLEEKVGIKKDKGIYTIQIATASELLGYKTKFYSKHLGINPENLKMDFYKKYAEEFKDSDKIFFDAKSAGVEIYEKTLSLENLLKFVSKDSIPIILLDWNLITSKEEKGYQGHFVPIIGYNTKSVYVHNHGLNNPKEFMEISRKLFDKARKAKGTDEDLLIIHRKVYKFH